ncbi:unnamed protein product [Ambrosiozyma monospora]|uniref:Unnamed protein product n=1 Tax=Ambrosiozyma monospora TaxID=43982 RepID=A0ACB5SV55_AMBMO|nr:unnamed protein product [Ambrosiozyma monospora]
MMSMNQMPMGMVPIQIGQMGPMGMIPMPVPGQPMPMHMGMQMGMGMQMPGGGTQMSMMQHPQQLYMDPLMGPMRFIGNPASYHYSTRPSNIPRRSHSPDWPEFKTPPNTLKNPKASKAGKVAKLPKKTAKASKKASKPEKGKGFTKFVTAAIPGTPTARKKSSGSKRASHESPSESTPVPQKTSSTSASSPAPLETSPRSAPAHTSTTAPDETSSKSTPAPAPSLSPLATPTATTSVPVSSLITTRDILHFAPMPEPDTTQSANTSHSNTSSSNTDTTKKTARGAYSVLTDRAYRGLLYKMRFHRVGALRTQAFSEAIKKIRIEMNTEYGIEEMRAELSDDKLRKKLQEILKRGAKLFKAMDKLERNYPGQLGAPFSWVESYEYAIYKHRHIRDELQSDRPTADSVIASTVEAYEKSCKENELLMKLEKEKEIRELLYSGQATNGIVTNYAKALEMPKGDLLAKYHPPEKSTFYTIRDEQITRERDMKKRCDELFKMQDQTIKKVERYNRTAIKKFKEASSIDLQRLQDLIQTGVPDSAHESKARLKKVLDVLQSMIPEEASSEEEEEEEQEKQEENDNPPSSDTDTNLDDSDSDDDMLNVL